MLVLETIKKENIYEKENVYFQGFWPQVQNFCSAGFFTFSEHILPTACEYSMFLPLNKIKSQNIKVIGNKKLASNLKSISKQEMPSR